MTERPETSNPLIVPAYSTWRAYYRDPWHWFEAALMAAVPLILLYLHLR